MTIASYLRASARSSWSAAAAIAVLFLFAGRGLFAWFWQDDFFWLRLGPAQDAGDLLHILFAPRANGNMRPWSENLFFYGLSSVFGANPLPFRIVVFATLALDLWLLDAVVRHITGSRLAAFTTALCWLLNPCMATVYTWSAAYSQACYLGFMLAALLLLMRGRPRAQVVMFTLGLGALEHVMVYPAIAALYALLYDRRLLRGMWLLFAISTAYFALHMAVAPPPAVGPYELHVDGRMFATFASYAEMALGPQQLLHFQWSWPRWLAPVGTAIMVALLAACVRPAGRAGAFAGGLFLLLLAPVLPFPAHVMQYLLTGPVLGLGLVFGAALASGQHRKIALCGATCYLACCAPAAWQSTTWHLDRSELARALVQGVAAHARAHPGQAMLLTGMNTDQFMVGFNDQPFVALRVPHVFLAPDADRAIQDPWNEARTRVMPRDRALALLDAGGARVLDVTHGRMRDVTVERHAEWRRSAGR